MTILVVTRNFPPHTGGIETHIYEVVKRWRSWGERVAVLTPRMLNSSSFDRMQPFNIVRMWGATLPFFKVPITLLYILQSMITQRRVRIIYVTSWYPYGLLAMFASCISGVGFVVEAHGMDVVPKKERKILQSILAHVLRHARWIIALGNYQRISLIKQGIQGHKIRVVMEGVDPKKFNPNIDTSKTIEKCRLKGKKVILTVARLVKRKGHDMVIQALPKVIEEIPDVIYLIVGSGPNEASLRMLVQRLQLTNYVVFAGYVSDEYLPAYHNACDVFVMASREMSGDVEGFGLVYLEANACGKPVIGGRSGGVKDAVLDGVTGILVDPLKHEAVADALIRLLKDSDMAKRLGENGRQRVQTELNFDNTAMRIYEILMS